MNDDILSYDRKYSELSQFIGGYFHQNWKSTRSWKNEKPDWKTVVSDYKKMDPPKYVNQVIKELKELLSENLSDKELEKILDEFGSCIYAPGLGFNTYREWCNEILRILQDK